MAGWLSVAGMSSSDIPAMDARLLIEGYDETRIVSASDIQLSLLFDNTSFGRQLKNCISKSTTSGRKREKKFHVHKKKVFQTKKNLLIISVNKHLNSLT